MVTSSQPIPKNNYHSTNPALLEKEDKTICLIARIVELLWIPDRDSAVTAEQGSLIRTLIGWIGCLNQSRVQILLPSLRQIAALA